MDDRRISIDFSALSSEEYKTYPRWYSDLVHRRGGGGLPLEDLLQFLDNFGISENDKTRILDLFDHSVEFVSKGQFNAILRIVSHVLEGRTITKDVVFEQAPVPKPKSILVNSQSKKTKSRKKKTVTVTIIEDIQSYDDEQPTPPLVQPHPQISFPVSEIDHADINGKSAKSNNAQKEGIDLDTFTKLLMTGISPQSNQTHTQIQSTLNNQSTQNTQNTQNTSNNQDTSPIAIFNSLLNKTSSQLSNDDDIQKRFPDINELQLSGNISNEKPPTNTFSSFNTLPSSPKRSHPPPPPPPRSRHLSHKKADSSINSISSLSSVSSINSTSSPIPPPSRLEKSDNFPHKLEKIDDPFPHRLDTDLKSSTNTVESPSLTFSPFSPFPQAPNESDESDENFEIKGKFKTLLQQNNTHSPPPPISAMSSISNIPPNISSPTISPPNTAFGSTPNMNSKRKPPAPPSRRRGNSLNSDNGKNSTIDNKISEQPPSVIPKDDTEGLLADLESLRHELDVLRKYS